jgi:hypothetical protein
MWAAGEIKMFPRQAKYAKMNGRLIARRKETQCEEASDAQTPGCG